MATVSNQTVSPQKLQGDDKDNSNIFQLIRSQQKNLLRYVLLRRFVRLLTVFASIATPQSQTTTTNSTCFSFFGLWASQPVTVLVSLATVAVALTQEDASKNTNDIGSGGWSFENCLLQKEARSDIQFVCWEFVI
ncbi:uncharacterized protein LOC115707706 isoform X1 [Cannabis sativa]|uniref:uncharacterized protein LOC115707706 isoform X1 n=1 Tax=Cannabis sativa TaxID=3483 RepID=UPI0011DF63A8|nr:uncharacterized protein LOC115707706 isoform X1 [Cannabis sativa]